MISIHPAEKPETGTGLRKQRSGGVKSTLYSSETLNKSLQSPVQTKHVNRRTRIRNRSEFSLGKSILSLMRETSEQSC
jgi:hypothetical protein